MAATREVYTKKIFYITGDTGVTVYLPKALSSYKNSSSEASSVTDARFCAEHYCDLVRHYECPDPDDDSKTEYCCAGFLKETPSTTQEQINHRMHNLHTGSTGDGTINRQGKIRIRYNNIVYFMLNDGGLNTRPYASLCPVSTGNNQQSPLIWADEFGVSFWMNYKNAKYCRTDYIKVRIKIYNATSGGSQVGSTIDVVIPGINTAKGYSEYESDPFRANVSINAGDFVYPNYFTMQLLATNEEGTFEETLDTTRYQIRQTITAEDVVKIPTPTSSAEDGVAYKVVLNYEMYRHAVSGETPGGHTYDYPTIWNVYNNQPGHLQTSFQLYGSPANSGVSPSSTLLDPGYYLNFPSDWARDPGTFEETKTYQPGLVSYISGAGMDSDHTEDQGYLYKWYQQATPTPTPTPPEECVITAGSLIAHISGLQSSDSETAIISTAIYDQNNHTLTGVLYPYVSLIGTPNRGQIYVPVRFDVYVNDELQPTSYYTVAQPLLVASGNTGSRIYIGCNSTEGEQIITKFSGCQYTLYNIIGGASPTSVRFQMRIESGDSTEGDTYSLSPSYSDIATVNNGILMTWTPEIITE